MGVGDVDSFVLKRSYQLGDGDQRAGDQVVFAYDADLGPESLVDGDLTLAGDHVTLDATVRGDVTIVADRLKVGETALIAGDLIACVNTLDRHANAQITGEMRKECATDESISLAEVVQAG